MDKATIWTAAACQGNPGPGGYAVTVLLPDSPRTKRHGGRRRTTLERMEIFAAIAGLSVLTEPTNVELRTSSRHLVNTVNTRSLLTDPDLAPRLLPMLERHNTIAILQPRNRTQPEHREAYHRALRASQKHPTRPDTGFEQLQVPPDHP